MHSGFQELLDEFLLEARERADEVEAQLLQLSSSDSEVRQASLAQAKRELHTLKGNSGMMGFTDLQQLAHQMEDGVALLDLEEPRIDTLLTDLDDLRRGLETVYSTAQDEALTGMLPAAPATEADTAGQEPGDAEPQATTPREGSVRVSFSKIDQLVELQGESLIFRNRLSDAILQGMALMRQGGGDPASFLDRCKAAWEDVEQAQQALEKALNQLQTHVTDLGMVPLQSLFRSLRRIVHDESTRVDKRVELEIHGGDTPIDKTLLEAAGDALGHLVRNAVIHGIEAPADRLRLGKQEIGRVRLAARLEANEVWIEVADDGGGLDLAALASQARELGRELPDEGADIALLFEEGLSTHGGADLSAGRGVGLSAVKRSVEAHGGRIDVKSQAGLGTSFSLRLPVTASILRSLLLAVDDEEYALPLPAVTETLRLREQDRHEVNRAAVVRWRGRLLPLLDLGLTFGTAESPRSDGFVVVIEVSGRNRGLLVDDIVGIRDIVVKGLDRIVGRPVGISGSTILGDGRIVMLLDPATLTTVAPFVQ